MSYIQLIISELHEFARHGKYNVTDEIASQYKPESIKGTMEEKRIMIDIIAANRKSFDVDPTNENCKCYIQMYCEIGKMISDSATYEKIMREGNLMEEKFSGNIDYNFNIDNIQPITKSWYHHFTDAINFLMKYSTQKDFHDILEKMERPKMTPDEIDELCELYRKYLVERFSKK